MRLSLALINDLPRRKTVNAAQFRHPGWVLFGCIMFGVTCWTGVGFGIGALAGWL